MKRQLLTLAVALIFGLSWTHAAQPRSKPAPDAAPAGESKPPRSPNGRPLPYKAKITALDEQAATFSSAGKAGATNVFVVTEKTTITKDGKPATFGDLAVGSVVAGVRTHTLGGKWEVSTVNIQGLDTLPKPRGAKKETAAKSAEKKDDAKPAAQTEITPAPADAPKTTDPAQPAEPKTDVKPEEKKAE